MNTNILCNWDSEYFNCLAAGKFLMTSAYLLPAVLGIWGEGLFVFRELGSTGNYLQGSREQAHSFGDLGSPAKK